MKTINQYIIEKFKLSSKNIERGLSDAEIDELIEKYKDKRLKGSLYIDVTGFTNGELKNNFNKVQEYQKKGSKPERLVSSIKNKSKLIGRWIAAMDMGWEDAGKVFKQAIIDRGYYNEEDLNHYIIKRMINDEEKREHYKVYL